MKTIVTLMVVFLTINFSVAQEAEKEAEKLSPSMELMKLLNIEDTMENTSKMAFAPFLNQLRTKGMAEAGVKEVKEASDVYFSQVAPILILKKRWQISTENNLPLLKLGTLLSSTNLRSVRKHSN